MKKIIYLLALCFSIFSCRAQSLIKKDISGQKETNYVLANMQSISHKKELYNGSFFVKVFEINDSRATSESSFDETDEVLKSLLISVIPDGDYYTSSKLYKVEGLINPEILEIQEKKYPFFTIKVKHGNLNEKKVQILKFTAKD